MDPLTKIARYGAIFEIISYQKPLVTGGAVNRTGIKHRKREETTQKLKQNIWRTKRRIKRVVSAVTYLKGAPAFATFTYATPQHNMQEAIEDWRQYTKKMKKKFPAVAFLRVPERHKSGAVHFHAVLFGLPDELPCYLKKRGYRWSHACPLERRCERRTRLLAEVWGKGFVDLQESRNPESIGTYIAKYLTKGEPDWNLFGHHVASCNQKMYEYIREARKRGSMYELSSYKAGKEVDIIIEDMQKRMSPRVYREFQSKWLGHAQFRLYTVEKELKEEWFDKTKLYPQ